MQTGPGTPGFSLADLRRAIVIYLAEAYPGGADTVPASVRRRSDWPDGASIAEILIAPRFEVSAGVGADPDCSGSIYALRLGNADYPHMKLQAQDWPSEAGYMLSVNTHDQIVGLDPAAADSVRFRALQSENQRFKEAIERAWDREGLPTFLRYLRDYLAESGGVGGTPGDATA